MKVHVVQTGELMKTYYDVGEDIQVVTQVSARSEAGPTGIQFNMQVLKGGKMIFFSDNPANLPRWLNE